jgi:hypothetical protein
VSENIVVASEILERDLLVSRVAAVLLELPNPDDPVVLNRGGRGSGGGGSYGFCPWVGDFVAFAALL